MDKLIVGIGNASKKYEYTRHNLGFRIIDEILRTEGVTPAFTPRKNARVQPITLQGVRALLVKPETFVNSSGQAVAILLKDLRLCLSDLIVLHDELDMQPGLAKMCVGGGAGGHNGVRDIIIRCGAEFCRVKVGVGKPEPSSKTAKWVLGVPPAEEEAKVREILPIIVSAVSVWGRDGADKAITWMNTRTRRIARTKS